MQRSQLTAREQLHVGCWKQEGEMRESKAMAALKSKNSVSWKKGKKLGKGSFGMVNMAFFCNRQNHHLLVAAVKSCQASKSSTLREEAIILSELRGSPHIVRCLGHDSTVEGSKAMYNVFLEYVSGGTLGDKIKTAPSGLHESHVSSYAGSILRGLSYIHSRGYVHCDIKPHNLLLCSASQVKIADFGLAKKVGERAGIGLWGFRGTPLYLAPESVRHAEYEPAVDIWALGCVVLEMVTGKTAWERPVDGNVNELLFRIGFSQRLPEIPGGLSEEGKDFLRRCLIRDPQKRWTADMLLQHPFIMGKVIREECPKQPDIQLPVPSKTAFRIPHPSTVLQLTCKAKQPEVAMTKKASKTGQAAPDFLPLAASSVTMGEETSASPDFIPLAESSAMMESSVARQKSDDFIPLSVSSTRMAADQTISGSLCRTHFPFLPHLLGR